MVMPTEPIPTPLAGENPTLEERLRELAKRVELSTGVFRSSPTLDQTRDTINLSREAAGELTRLRADVERLTAERDAEYAVRRQVLYALSGAEVGPVPEHGRGVIEDAMRVYARAERAEAMVQCAYTEAVAVVSAARAGATKVPTGKERETYLCFAEMAEYIARALTEGAET
jgi:hypothetical protein